MPYQEPSISTANYIDLVTTTFSKEADPLRAEQQMAYMRNQFEYLGIGAAKWYPIAKEIFAKHGMYTGTPLKEFVEGCYDQPYREIMYVSIDMMQRMLKFQNKSFISVIEKCITTHSWWDTVDWLAKLACAHFKKFPELQFQYAYKWIESDNMWLQRSAIIHQIAYKKDTDEKLLFDLIEKKVSDKEFFIRKACGWALREYSKIQPKAVTKFVKSHTLSPLTQKEAMRLILKGK